MLRGVICLLKVVDGTLKKGDRVVAASTEETYDVLEVSAFPLTPRQKEAPVVMNASLFCCWLSNFCLL